MLTSKERAAPDSEPATKLPSMAEYPGGTSHPVEDRALSEMDRLERVLARGTRALRRSDPESAVAHLTSVRSGVDQILRLLGDIA